VLVSAMALVPACTPGQHVAKVDEEVYDILKSAEKYVYNKNTEYRIDEGSAEKLVDTLKSENLRKISEKSGTVELSIEQTLAYAVQYSNSYQSQKEALYLAGLSMSTTRIPFEWGGRSTANISQRGIKFSE